jgi:hypothetical protein
MPRWFSPAPDPYDQACFIRLHIHSTAIVICCHPVPGRDPADYYRPTSPQNIRGYLVTPLALEEALCGGGIANYLVSFDPGLGYPPNRRRSAAEQKADKRDRRDHLRCDFNQSFAFATAVAMT